MHPRVTRTQSHMFSRLKPNIKEVKHFPCSSCDVDHRHDMHEAVKAKALGMGLCNANCPILHMRLPDSGPKRAEAKYAPICFNDFYQMEKRYP